MRAILVAATAVVLLLAVPAPSLGSLPLPRLVQADRAVLKELPLPGWKRDPDVTCSTLPNCVTMMKWRPSSPTNTRSSFREITMWVYAHGTRSATIDKVRAGCETTEDVTGAEQLPAIGNWNLLCHRASSDSVFFGWTFAMPEWKAVVVMYATAGPALKVAEGFQALLPIAEAEYGAICRCAGPN